MRNKVIYTVSGKSETSENHQKEVYRTDVTAGNGMPIKETDTIDFETAIAEAGYGKFHYCMLLATVVANWTNVFDTTSVSYLLPSAECDLNLSNVDKGLLNGITYMGMIASAYMWGFLSDTLGRKMFLIIGYFLDFVFNLMASMAQEYWFLLLCKFMTGFVICGPLSVLMSYLAEFHGLQHRSRIMMLTGMFMSLAQLIVPILAWTIIPQAWSWQVYGFKYNSWRIFIAFCSLPSLISTISFSFFPESPKYLMSCGRYSEALEIFKKVYAINTGNNPESYPIKSLIGETHSELPDVTSITPDRQSICQIWKLGWKQTKPMFLPPLLWKCLLLFSLQSGSLIGLNTLRLWLPQLFATMEEYSYLQHLSNISNKASFCEMLESVETGNDTNILHIEDGPCTVVMTKDTVYINSMIVGGTAALAFVVNGIIVNAIGNKKLALIAFLLAAILCTALYWSYNMQLTIALSALYVAMNSTCATAIVAIIVDIFPTNLRTMSVSLSMMFGEIGAFLGNLLFPLLLDISCGLPFFALGFMSLVCAVVMLLV